MWCVCRCVSFYERRARVCVFCVRDIIHINKHISVSLICVCGLLMVCFVCTGEINQQCQQVALTSPVNENILQSLLGRGEKPEAVIICSAWKMAWREGGCRTAKSLHNQTTPSAGEVLMWSWKYEQWKNGEEKELYCRKRGPRGNGIKFYIDGWM